MKEAGIEENSAVLEIGAGNGFFTEMLARRARRVYAVELQDGMVKKLKKRLGGLISKVEIIGGDAASSDLGEKIADVGFLYYVFHEIENQEAASKNIGRAIKLDGVLSLYEPTVEVSRRGMDKTVGMFASLGMVVEERRDGLFTRFARLRKIKI